LRGAPQAPHVSTTPEGGPPSSAKDLLLRSMLPPLAGDDDPEDTRVATVVGAPAYRPQQQAAASKTAYLTVIAGNRAGEMFKLAQDETIMGRGPQSTIHLDSDGVSRKHARVVRQGDDFVLEDLQSTNGTWVDEKRITFHKLKDGDRVQVGTEVIVRFNLHDELEAALQQQLYESAVRDPLTRAYNRKHFAERLRAELAHATRHKTHLSLIILDIDFFKKVNDTYGHPAGDAVLRSIAAAIQKVIRVEDVFARIGGEEFALLARGIDGGNGSLFAERLRKGIERLSIPWSEITIPVTSSFGVATFTELADPRDGDAFVAIADRRLYQAKSQGRNRVVGPGM
jgi:diguanylate cyclase (GGDEF)-like protein